MSKPGRLTIAAFHAEQERAANEAREREVLEQVTAELEDMVFRAVSRSLCRRRPSLGRRVSRFFGF